MKLRPFKYSIKVANYSLGHGGKKIIACLSLNLELPSSLVIISAQIVFSSGKTSVQLSSPAPRLGTGTFHGRSVAQCLN